MLKRYCLPSAHGLSKSFSLDLPFLVFYQNIRGYIINDVFYFRRKLERLFGALR